MKMLTRLQARQRGDVHNSVVQPAVDAVRVDVRDKIRWCIWYQSADLINQLLPDSGR
jgi:hypothetical protein